MSTPSICPSRILMRVLLCVALLPAPLATATPEAQAALPAEETELSGGEVTEAKGRPRQTTGTGIYYVKADASGADNGTSWEDAYRRLQDALAVAASGDQVWVATGVYTPSTALTRRDTFLLAAGVAVYGGFAGTEDALSERDWATHVVTLTGDLRGDDTPNFGGYGDNSYRVATGAADAILDGVTITGGNANGFAFNDSGGGLYATSSMTLTNVAFAGNTARWAGGGAYFAGTATLTGTTFTGNTAWYGGGAYFAGTTTLTGTTLSGNTASDGFGGGAYFHSAAALTGTTFTGNTANRDGGGAYFNGTATLTGTTFTGNTASSGGGGAFFAGGARLTNTTFISNTANSSFGGGASFNSTAILTDTAFTGNTAAADGGGAYFVSTATLTGTTFTGNTANYGGGAYFVSTATLTDTTFTGNTAHAKGGGAWFNQPANLAGGAFVGNRADSNGGGGVWVGDAAVNTLSGTVFFNNSSGAEGGGADMAGPMAVTNTTFISNTAGGRGGGVWFDWENSKQLVNVLFARNSAGMGGAALYVQNAAPAQLSHVTVVSPTLAGGAAIAVNGGTAYITNTIVANHSLGLEVSGGTVSEDYNLFDGVTTPIAGSPSSGGHSLTGAARFVNPPGDDYHLGPGSAAIDAGTSGLGVAADFEGDPRPQGLAPDIGYDEAPPLCFTEYTGDNTADFSSGNASAVRAAIAAAPPGGTVKIAGYCAGAVAESDGTQVARLTKTLTLAGGYTPADWTAYNPAANPTTLDALGGGLVLYITATATLRGFTVTQGYTSGGNGGGIFALSALTLTDMMVYRNTAYYGGGAYFASAATLTGTTFTGNTATGLFGSGGAYFASTATLTGTTFTGNTSTGLVGVGGAYFASAATLTGTTFIGNTANGDGGGAYFYAAAALTSTTFTSNTAYRGGGAYFNGTTTLTGTTFTGNTASSGGGGAYFNSTATLTGTTFTGNTATGLFSGGGAYFNSTATLTGTTFTGNTASYGYGGGAYFVSTATLTDTIFISNTASLGGGAWFKEPANLASGAFVGNRADSNGGGGVWVGVTAVNTLSGTVFFDNSSGANGGGADMAGPVAVTNTTFISNTASGKGGGVWFDWENSKQMVNVLFARNSAGMGGSALYVQNALPAQLSHVTVVSPTLAEGAAIYINGGTVHITNTLIANYTTGIQQAEGAMVNSDYNLFYNAPTSIITGTHSLTGTDPLFVDLLGGNYHVASASPARGAGLDLGVAADVDGHRRGTPPTIGAYEAWWFCYLPLIRR